MSHETIDAKRLLCPMPVIKLQNAVKSKTTGDSLEIICTDPGTLNDIPSWCRIYKHELVSTVQADNEITFIIKVGVVSHA